MLVDEITGEDLIAMPIEQYDRLRGMPRQVEDLEGPASQVECLTICDEACDGEWSLVHRVQLQRADRVDPLFDIGADVWAVDEGDAIERSGISDVIIVKVGEDHRNRLVARIAHCHLTYGSRTGGPLTAPCIEHKGSGLSDEEIRRVVLRGFRFVDGKGLRIDRFDGIPVIDHR